MGWWEDTKAVYRSHTPLGWIWPAEEEPLPLPERPSLGLESKRLQQEHAKNIASYLNRSLTANIGQIGRNVAQLGRGDSGIRNQMIQQAVAQSNWTGANIAGQGSLDVLRMALTGQLTREQMDEERAWRQAQLDVGGQQDYSQMGESIMNILMMSQGIPPVAGMFGQGGQAPYGQQMGYQQPLGYTQPLRRGSQYQPYPSPFASQFRY